MFEKLFRQVFIWMSLAHLFLSLVALNDFFFSLQIAEQFVIFFSKGVIVFFYFHKQLNFVAVVLGSCQDLYLIP